MSLPLFATTDDLKSLVRYLGTKPSGATEKEAKAALGQTLLDKRKLATAETLGIIVREGERWKLTPDVGRGLFRADNPRFAEILLTQMKRISAYGGCFEWAYHQGLETLTSSEVGAYWHDHHREELGTDKEESIAQRASCFLQLSSGAGLGEFIVGRRGQVSRLAINRQKLEEAVLDGITSQSEPSEVIPRDGNGHRDMPPLQPSSVNTAAREPLQSNRRVFLTHGKNKSLLGTLKELLAFGEFDAIASVERETVSQPVPDKVLEDMRKCGAAIIHVDAEKEIRDEEGAAQVILNPNVLIEIGAAMALYGRRFILLVRDGVKLPSNLQGLYEVRYQGDRLDSDVAIKLLKAINDIKNHPLPTFGGSK